MPSRRRRPAATTKPRAPRRPAEPAVEPAREGEAEVGAAEPDEVEAELVDAAAVEAAAADGAGADGDSGAADGDPGPAAPPLAGTRRALPARTRAEAGGLTRYDPLRAYMAEVARHPVLSREEERELALRYQRTGDVDAAYRLVASNLRLVVKIAHEYRRSAFHLLDLVQEGNMGLMQAVKKYDPLKGVKLSSYAAWWIRAYIIRFVMDNWRMVKLGTTQAQRKLFFNLAKERQQLLARGVEPTPRLLAKNLRVEEREVEEMSARMGSEDLSLDAPLPGGDEGGGDARIDHVAGAGAAPDDALAGEELKRRFREKLLSFARTISDPKEKLIFERRLLPPEGEEPLTLQELGDRFGLTRERARQIEAKLVGRLREELRAELPDFELLTPSE